ncbi:SGNH/GDSL hydrolase family protein [Paenibacillus sp. FSL R10-2734]|uniref:SGNH/GDSL hydrolase family protein n=1 Tax=Paenibacillus sp. FSL R10-2734 TaxID=2954691 RepID=UPI0030D6D93F
MANTKKRTIVCFGDSNTWGYDAETDHRFNDEIRWTGLLHTELGDAYRVIEEGLPGRTSVSEDPLFEGLAGISYLYPCLMSHAPLDLVVIMLGTNDTKERFALTSYNIAQGIVRLALKARASGAGLDGKAPEVLVIAPPPIGAAYIHTPIGKSMGSNCSEKSIELSEHLAALLTGTDIHFMDSREDVSMNEIDYMHLDQQGHRNMADLVQYHVKRILN